MPLISEAVEPQPIPGPTYLGSIQCDPKPDKEKSERDALTIAMEFKTPESEREMSKKETGQKRSVAEKDAQSPLNPKRPKEADHDDKTTRELFGSVSEEPKECEVTAGTNTEDAAPHDDDKNDEGALWLGFARSYDRGEHAIMA